MLDVQEESSHTYLVLDVTNVTLSNAIFLGTNRQLFVETKSQLSYCKQLVASAVQQLGNLDILVNVADKQQEVQDIANLTTEQFDETFKTNV